MDKFAAQRLVRETLQNSFDKRRFTTLVKNILNHFEENTFTYTGTYIFDAFADSIRKVERIGKYLDPNDKSIDILIVHLKRDNSLERARTMQRNYVAKYLKGSRGGALKDAALVAFVAPNGEDWRFSLVKMEYKFKETPSGKVKVEEEFTPARRYSFLVGKNENSHTAQSQLLPLLLDDETPPTLEDLENAFSVETVTKEFFEKYRTLFLRELFEKKHKDYNNFFNDILEPLFYEALLGRRLQALPARAVREKTQRLQQLLQRHLRAAFLRSPAPGDYYSHFNCRIPFLNGGLFDPINDYDWWNTDILLPNDIFSNDRKTKEGDIGDGILDIFDRYNFTVKEDEPLEKEVAVDPEMLGKVFENLLEVKHRKSKGTYYTPREIVHYMCQESLVNYLSTELDDKIDKKDIETLIKYGETVVEHDSRVANHRRETTSYTYKLPESVRKHAKRIDQLLATIRVCDPAVGSGAFLVGMMHEIVRTRNALTPYLSADSAQAGIGENGKRTPYHFKRHAIQYCLYGVDIDPGAVEICKLRLWLSLVVDEENRETVQPLPNLEYKIVQGNSLLSVRKNLFNQQLFAELEQLKPLYFNETTSKKQEYKSQIDQLISLITNGHKDFDFEVYFSEVFHEKGGFDVVIGNPPYIQLQKALNNQQKYADLYKNAAYETFDRRGDIYCLFYELGMRIARQKGILTYITSNKWMRAAYGKKLREFFTQHNPLVLIDLGPNVFETATVDTNILIVQKATNQNHLVAATINESKKDNLDIAEYVQNNAVTLTKLTHDAWFIGSEAELRLKEKIERTGKPLKEWDVKIYYGIKTGLNKAFIITTEKRNEILANCRDEDERRRTEAIIKPILRGRDIKRYYYEWAGLWVIVAKFGFHKEAHLYPTIVEHLKQYEDRLKNRGQCKYTRQGKGGNKDYPGQHHWLELDNNPQDYYLAEFEKEKVVWQELAQGPQFSMDKNGHFFVSNTGYILTGNHLKYIIGYLNSKLNEFTYDKWYCTKIGQSGTRWLNQHIQNIPIPPVTPANAHLVRQIEALVDTILAAKKQNHQADTSEYEKQIDQLVYKLYGLTPEEIKIVENYGAK